MVPRKLPISGLDENANEIEEFQNNSPHVKEILYENYYYDVTEWIKKHPGGRVIEYYTHSGEDATIAIQQFHQRSTKRVMSIMASLKRRPASEKEIRNISPRYKALTDDFVKLYKELLDEGLFKPSIPHVIMRLGELLMWAFVGIYIVNSEQFIARVFGVICLTFYFGRSGWVQHESGHYSLTGKPKIDRLIQSLVWGPGGGMSASWWRNQHNRHHAMPQRIKRDVDLETLPLIAFNAKVVKNPKHGKSFFVKYQVYLFLVVDTLLVSSFWKFFLHWKFVCKNGYYIEMLLMFLNFYFFYHLGTWTYFLVLWLTSIYLFVNFSLSHSHLPVTDESLHWVEFALLHTTNINSSRFCDFWMGYLNYQIEHHLFPTMPQFRNSKIVSRVKELARKHNIPYRCMSYSQALVQSFTNLHKVSEELNH